MFTQCGLDPGQSFLSFFSFSCCRPLLPWCFQPSTTALLSISYVRHRSDVLLSLTHSIAATVQVLNFTVCGGTFIPSVPALLGVYCAIPRFLISFALLILAVVRTLKQSVEMYNATRQWQPNQYIKIFVRDGIFYFFVYVSFILLPGSKAKLGILL